MKLGRNTDDYSRPKLDLTELAASADFSMVPPSADYRPAAQLQMLGNDVAGDCEAARWANHRLLMTGAYPASVMDDVWAVYKTQNPNFDPNGDPNTTGPGSPADGGMSSDQLLSYLHSTGGPDGSKVVAYGLIDPRNVQAVERAIALFGGVWVDILVQPGNQTEFANRQPWTDTGEQPEGGHAVLADGYVPQRRFLTWADETTFADSFWNGSTQEGPLVERVYLVIWPEHATKEFIASQGAQQLAADYQALTGKTLVWPDAPTPTPPAPVPPTPPSPVGASFLVSDPSVVDHIVHVAARRGVDPNVWVTQHFEHYFRVAALVAEDLALFD